MAGTLTFVRWYCKKAVYLDGRLVLFGEINADWSLLQVLGFECADGGEVPTHQIPPEYDLAPNGWWEPPECLEVLERQQATVKERLRREEIERLRAELARLEGT